MTQTVKIPADHRRLTIEVPREIPAGEVIIAFTPAALEANAASSAKSSIRACEPEQSVNAALRRAYGAWKNNPWTNHLEDVNDMRNKWEHRK